MMKMSPRINMKRILTAIACTLGLAVVAPAANAATITLDYGDAFFLGTVDPNNPPNPDNEIDFINSLIGLAQGALPAPCEFGPAGNTCDRVGSTLGNGPFPEAIALVDKDENEVNSMVAIGAFTYVLAKYDNTNAGSWVWLVSGAAGDTVEVPQSFSTGHDVSHISLFSADEFEQVPDGGAAVGLLGLAMLGVGYLRRRVS
jgi:hypothetical protein